METTSGYLADQIACYDEGLTAEELSKNEIDRELLLKSVEQLFHNTNSTIFTVYHQLQNLAKLRNLAAFKIPPNLVQDIGDHAAWSLDDCLTRLMLSEIPRMVSRAVKLEPVLVAHDAHADENPYLREATRCYVFGLFSASVALSRSALELALSKTPKLVQTESREDSLLLLIKIARVSILKHAQDICDLADKTRKKANAVIHGKECRETEALEVLNDTRRILLFLYKSA